MSLLSTQSIDTALTKPVPKLYNFLSTQDIESIQKHFKKQKSAGLNYDKFRSLLARYDVTYTDDEFRNVCLKVDLDRDNAINWSEFIAYFILELENDDAAKERMSIIPPIPNAANVISSALQSSAAGISFMGGQSSDGKYVTVGCYGEVNFWSSKWKLERASSADEIPGTFSRAIELADKRQIKKSPRTLILDACNLSDLQIICISSVCGDLRFYDYSTMGKCNLRLYIRCFPSPVVAIHFHCSTDSSQELKLIFGDMAGTVRVIDFEKSFKFRHGSVMRQFSYQELMKDKCEGIKCIEYMKLHGDVIRQVSFIESLHSFVSASESVIAKGAYLPSVIIRNILQETQIVFKINSGATCFAFHESSTTLATGGPDCILRLWNFIDPIRPKAVLSGHTAGIIYIFMQDDAAKIYTIDKKKIIKIWDVTGGTLLQTFAGLKTVFSEKILIKPLYNDSLRELVCASRKIATVKCHPTVDPNKTDGYTHMSGVSVIVFNELYNFLVTCSMCSTIIVWDVFKGRRINLITQAHTRVVHGEVQLMAISAGCFDPKHQFLLTASDDGTIKVWNFNEGICLRTVKIQAERRVSMLFWDSQRIFAMGSKVVSKFHDSKDSKMQITFGSSWKSCHWGQIICASVRELDAIATSCTGGDLIFWDFITGHPYLRFKVSNPQQRLPVIHQKKFDERRKSKTAPEAENTIVEMPKSLHLSDCEILQRIKIKPTAQCILSLTKRPMHPSTATFLVSLTNGQIQGWSHHRTGGCYITEFEAIHVAGDVITAMTTDTQNCYLFTGSTMGYIKTWLIVNFCSRKALDVELSQVKLREIFPLLSCGKNEGEVRQSEENPLTPQLLNSYQGHKKSITAILYFEKNQLVISSSLDKSVRLWNLSGQYIGTIGSSISWTALSPNKPPPYNYVYRMPPDLRSSVSETTLAVLEGGYKTYVKEVRNSLTKNLRSSELDEGAKPFQRTIQKHIMKKDDQADTQRRYEKPILDISLTHIPVYSHLRIHPTVAINLPQTIPKCLETNNLPNLKYIFLEPDGQKAE